MDQDIYSADCSRCFGLCCTALSFERSAQFGHDKMAGQPCQYLQQDFRCRIHERLDDLGYGGCDAFDCLGAGPRASAAFAAENWQRDPAVARKLYARFSQLLKLQEMRQALDTAASLEIPAEAHQHRLALFARVSAEADSGANEPTESSQEVLNDGKAFLRSLADILANSPR